MGVRTLATVVAILLIATTTSAQTEGRVAGRVVDQTGAVLPGVAIDLVVNKTEMTTTTDGNGHYLFEGVPAGTGELTFRLLNFGVLRRLVSVTRGQHCHLRQRAEPRAQRRCHRHRKHDVPQHRRRREPC